MFSRHSLLPNKEALGIIKDKTTGELRGVLPQDEDSGSDFDVD